MGNPWSRDLSYTLVWGAETRCGAFASLAEGHWPISIVIHIANFHLRETLP